MMGRTHAATGLLAGVLTGSAVGIHNVAQLAVFTATTAGYALLPDLDHPDARASRLLGPVTGLLSRGLRAASARLYEATKGPRDEDCAGTHRHLTHTVLFALLLGVAAGFGAAASPWAAAAIVLFGLLLAENALGDWLAPFAAVAVAGWWMATPNPGGQLHEISVQLGIAVGVGCITHCLGDALTESGCPFLFPLPIAGETWYELRPPSLLRFRTNSRVERRVIFPATVLACVLAVPGVWPVLVEAISVGARLAGAAT